jgi:hypothetical protein
MVADIHRGLGTMHLKWSCFGHRADLASLLKTGRSPSKLVPCTVYSTSAVKRTLKVCHVRFAYASSGTRLGFSSPLHFDVANTWTLTEIILAILAKKKTRDFLCNANVYAKGVAQSVRLLCHFTVFHERRHCVVAVPSSPIISPWALSGSVSTGRPKRSI